MALPVEFGTVTLAGKYVDLAGVAVAGSVSFNAPSILTAADSDTFVVPKPFTATLDASGAFTIVLPATNDPDISPTFTYRVVESFTSSAVSKGRTYDIEIPFDTVGTLQLADIAPVAPFVSGTAYLTSAQADVLSLGAFNVKSYAAVGDGVADDTAAVHAARDAAGVGGTIVFPAGTYKGNFTMSVAGQTWIFADGAGCRCNTTTTPIITITASAVTLRGGTLTGDWNWASYVGQDVAPAISGNGGVYVHPSASISSVSLEGITFTRFGVFGLRAYLEPGITVSDLALSGCRFIQNREAATVRALESGCSLVDFSVRDCYFDQTWTPSTRDNSSLGGNYLTVSATPTDSVVGITIEDNVFTDACGRMAVEIWSTDYTVALARDVRISGNRIGESFYRTLSLICDDLTFANNEVIDFHSYVETFGDSQTFEGNTFLGPHIWPNKSPGAGVVRGNTFRLLDLNAPLKIWWCGQWLVEGNTFWFETEILGRTTASGDGHESAGFQVIGSQGVSVRNNQFRYKGVVGSVLWLDVRDCQSADISNNVWYIEKSATDAGSGPSTTARVSLHRSSDCRVKDNRVVSEIALTAVNYVMRENNTPGGFTRRSWSGSAWVDETLQGILQTPPGSPSTGDEYVVGTTPTGAWVGHGGSFAEWDGASWTYRTISAWVAPNSATASAFWVNTTPATGTVGDHLCVTNAPVSLRNAWINNDFKGERGGAFPVRATIADFSLDGDGATSGSGVYVGNRYDGTTSYSSTARVGVNSDEPYSQKFYGVKPSITGSRGSNVALADLLTKLAALGLITDGTS